MILIPLDQMIPPLYIQSRESTIPRSLILGVFLEENLTFNYHISKLTRSISKSLHSLKCAKNVLSSNILKSLYCSLSILTSYFSCSSQKKTLLYSLLIYIIQHKTAPPSFKGIFPKNVNLDRHEYALRETVHISFLVTTIFVLNVFPQYHFLLPWLKYQLTSN